MSEPQKRLFVPLSTQPFVWFLSGSKKWELRKYGRQYTEANLTLGRKVELRRGYLNSFESIWGEISDVVSGRSISEIFEKVEFGEVIPVAKSISEAIESAIDILGDDGSRYIAFKIDVNRDLISRILIKPEYLDLIRKGKKSTTIRSLAYKFNKGPAILDSGKYKVPIITTDVSTKPLSALSQMEAEADGFASIEELLTDLRRIYPGLSNDDEVQVLTFKTLENY